MAAAPPQTISELVRELPREQSASALHLHAQALVAQGRMAGAIAACKALLAHANTQARARATLADAHARAPAESGAARLFSPLALDEFFATVDALKLHVVPQGQPVVREGEAGSSMFAISEGTVEVLRQVPGAEVQRVAEMAEGDFFGEIALLSEAPRLATVRAAVPSVFLELGRAEVRAIAARHPNVAAVVQAFYRERLLLNVLRSNRVLATLPDAQKKDVARSFQLRVVDAGHVFMHQGDAGDGLYVLLRGRALPFHARAGGGETKHPDMGEGEVFGEISLLLGKPVTASVRAQTQCTVLFLPRADFERVLKAHPALRTELMQMGFERLQRAARVLSDRFSHHAGTLV